MQAAIADLQLQNWLSAGAPSVVQLWEDFCKLQSHTCNCNTGCPLARPTPSALGGFLQAAIAKLQLQQRPAMATMTDERSVLARSSVSEPRVSAAASDSGIGRRVGEAIKA